MSLTRYYAIYCDTCGWDDHFVGNAVDAVNQAKVHGWVVTEDGKHYCGAKCRDEYFKDKVAKISG